MSSPKRGKNLIARLILLKRIFRLNTKNAFRKRTVISGILEIEDLKIEDHI